MSCTLATAQDSPMVLPGNMKVLRCSLPTAEYRFVGSSAPGQLFFADEPVQVKLLIAKGADKGEVNWAIEIQEITTRDPDAKVEGTFTDTAGLAPKLGLMGDPVVHPLKITLADADTPVTIDNLPLPKRFGTYALVLVRGAERQFMASLCRVPKPQAKANLENTPIFGEFAMFDRPEMYDARAAACDRMGVRGLRLETSWSEREDGTYDWERSDKIFDAMEKHRLQVMVTLGGHHGWMWPFGPHKQTPAAVANTNWDGNPYWGQADWLCDPKYYPRYGKWIEAFCRRYWKDGKGALWGLENYNEPWEGGGISGWARDALQYRAIQKTIAEAAHKVDPKIKLAAASSIMNTEDKLYSDGSREFDQYVDVFTDHYVVPSMCYGPMVAKAHGKESVETETWFVNSEYLTPQIVQFLAAGQRRLSPWHPRVLFDKLPGTEDNYFIPTPAVAATAAFNYFVSGKEFQRLVFHDHLPWAFQFGKDNDKEGLLVVFGQLMSIAATSPKERLWAQVDGTPGGTMTIDNADGLLKFYDLAGNAQYVGQKQVVLPMSIYPTYMTSEQGPAAAAERLRTAKIEGKRPVEILPHELTTRVDSKGAQLEVTVHNCLNRKITGKLAIKAPTEIKLAAAEQQVELKAGERKRLSFAFASATPNAAQAYPFEFAFTSDGGDAKLAEIKNLAIAVKGTKQIDGNLDDWKDVPGVTVIGDAKQGDITENLRRPWLELKNQSPEGSFGEFKLAWDENFLYVAARVNDKSPQAPSPRMAGRDVNQYFHTAASDEMMPYKEFLKGFPGRSFASVPYVYRYSPEKPQSKDLPIIPFRRDRLHIALDVTDDWHDLEPTTNRVPVGFHAIPDTDYEYALYACNDGSELWRMLAPGVPRIHDFPRTLRGSRTTDAVPGAKHVVKLEGNTYTYELAIPKEELANLKLQAGVSFGLMLRGGNDEGPHVDYGADKAETKINGLTLHPYWERSSNCGVRWKLVE